MNYINVMIETTFTIKLKRKKNEIIGHFNYFKTSTKRRYSCNHKTTE